MKLYSDVEGTAPSPRRVRMFIAEKGLDVPTVTMDLHKENRTEEFREKNPLQTLPVLELDDGTCIAESIAICRYLEEAFPGSPQLFGTSPLEAAHIEMWNRRSELAFYLPIEFAGGMFGDRVARRARNQVDGMIRLFDEELASRDFIAGDVFSVADIITKVALDYGVRFHDIVVPAEVTHFRRWSERMDARASAGA